MIANFFNKTKPINFLALSVLLFVVFTVSSIFVFTGEFSWAYFFKKLYYFGILVFMLFTFNFIIRKNMLTDDNSYALLLYTLMFGIFPNSTENTNLILANFFLLFSFRKIYSLRSNVKTIEKTFDSGFWIGIACLFYTWSILYLVLIYTALLLFRKNDWRNVFIPLIGFFTPIFIVFVYYFATDNSESFHDLWHFLYSFDYSVYTEKRFVLPIILLIVFVIASIFPMLKKSFMAKKDFKNTWAVVNFHIIIALILVIISPQKNGSELIFLFFPVSILFANELQNIKKYWFKETIFYAFIIVYGLVYLL
jgi:hypothetical protein